MIDHDLIKRALAEDLQGGEDITSVATVSGAEKVVADFVARKAGVIAGIEAWKNAGKQIDTVNRIQANDLGELYEAGVKLIDIRKKSEYDSHRVLQAENIPLNQINKHLAAFVVPLIPGFAVITLPDLSTAI